MLTLKMKNFLWKNFDYKTYEKIQEVYSHFIQSWITVKYRRRKISYGNENADKTFYVIRLIGRAALFQYCGGILTHLVYADQQGYVPVVDMTSTDNAYYSPEKQSSNNVWEYYFEQPENFTLKQIGKSKNIILSEVFKKKYGSDLIDTALLGDKITLIYLSGLIKRWMKYNPKTIDYFENQYQNLIGCKGAHNVLGIHIRGTDYIALKPKGHSIQPDITYIIEMTNSLAEKWGIDLIYICTEDESMLQEFISEVNIPTVYTSCARVNQYIAQRADIMNQLVENQETKDPYISGLEYLNDIYLLAQCDYLLSGHGIMGTKYAILMNGGEYKGVETMYLGAYE